MIIVLRLCKMLMRPLLEYCVKFQSPCYRKDIIKLEGNSEEINQDVAGMEGLSYKERLNRLGLFLLERRRLRGDLIEAYKIMRCIDK
eukprot:g20031.t1